MVVSLQDCPTRAPAPALPPPTPEPHVLMSWLHLLVKDRRWYCDLQLSGIQQKEKEAVRDSEKGQEGKIEKQNRRSNAQNGSFIILLSNPVKI